VKTDKCGYCQVPRGAYHKPICIVHRMTNNYTGPIKFERDLSLVGMAPVLSPGKGRHLEREQKQ
jgi:hypothetical protein